MVLFCSIIEKKIFQEFQKFKKIYRKVFKFGDYMSMKNKRFVEIFSKIEMPNKTRSTLGEINIGTVEFRRGERKLNILGTSDKMLDEEHIFEFSRQIKKQLGFIDTINFDLKYIEDVELEKVLELYWTNILTAVRYKSNYWYVILRQSNYKMSENKLSICIDEKYAFAIKNNDLLNFIIDNTRSRFNKNIDIVFEIVRNGNMRIKPDDIYEDVTFSKEELGITADLNAKEQPKQQLIHGKKDYTKFKRTGNLTISESIEDKILTIAQNIEVDKEVVICGEIVELEVKPIKNDKVIVTFDVVDNTSAVTVKFFSPQDIFEAEISKYVGKKKGIIVKGRVNHDDFARELVVMATELCPADVSKAKIEDNEEVKRVELHLHTNMSAMDGVTPVSDLIKKAIQMGHKAVAITDHGVVQAFPDAMGAAKGSDLKVIYGVEGYFLDDTQYIATCSRNQSLDDTYVVFDLETTGLSNNTCTIIEIGAVKIKNGEVIERFSELIDPKQKLDAKIIELTKITDDMLVGKPELHEVLPKFIDFIKDTVLVAHNASFDVNFVNKYSREILGQDIDNTVVDTISLAQLLLPELKRYRLNLIAEQLRIELKNHHRAVDDAEATAQIFTELVSRLIALGLNTLDDVNLYAQENFDFRKPRTNHIIILVKNQQGLRNLYELVSDAHIKNFFKRPRILKSNLDRLREGLIIGGACEAGLFYDAILKNAPQNQVDKIAENYDYFEIQPPLNKEYLVRNGELNSIQDIENVDKRVLLLGDKYGKPVVATCDVHFLNKEDEIYRRIVMGTQGFSDADEQAPLYYRTTREMLDEFQYLGEETAYEVVVENTNKIADMVDSILPVPKGTFPPEMDNADVEIREICYKKAHSMYGETLPEVVEKRLERELGSIIKNGFSVMYIIAQKLVWNSLENGYLVGSRGSVGSSFAATMLEITEVNPLQPHYLCYNCKYSDFDSEIVISFSGSSGVDMPDKDCPVCGQKLGKDGHDIPFETFLGFDGDKEPDIDLNFSGEYQAKAHAYTEELFGEGFVFKAGTIGTIADKTAYGMVKKYYDEKGQSLRNAEVNRIKNGCVGIKRTTGQHPGGLMVVPSKYSIYDFCPIQRPANDTSSDVKTTHFDYHSISGRLLKLDILGHDVPTILKMLEEMTGVDPTKIDLGDKGIMSLFTSPEAMGVTEEDIMCNTGSLGLPEFGTNFVRTMLKDTMPNTFAELVRISGLSHGTDVWLNNGQDLVRDGIASLKEIIPTRDDIMVYLIIRGVDNLQAFTIMESVRKGKGMSAEQEALLVEHDIPRWYIDSCKKIKYMFPKGHAVAYVMMTVRIGYYKIHHPEAFYAAMLSMKAEDIDYETMCKGKEKAKETLLELKKLGNDASAKDKNKITILELIYEMYARGYNFVPIDIYKAKADKFILQEGGLMPPLATIPGLGGNAAVALVESREDGEFLNIENLRERTKITKTVIEIMKQNDLLVGMSETNQMSLF